MMRHRTVLIWSAKHIIPIVKNMEEPTYFARRECPACMLECLDDFLLYQLEEGRNGNIPLMMKKRKRDHMEMSSDSDGGDDGDRKRASRIH